MKQLDASQRTSLQQSHYNVLMAALNMSFGVNNEKLQSAKSIQEAQKSVCKFILGFVPPTVPQFVKFGTPDRLCDLAIEQNRLIYIPARDSREVFASGDTEMNSIDIFSFMPEQLGLADFSLPEGIKSMVATPLISMTKQKYGAIVLACRFPDALIPLVELPILRMVASSLAGAMQVNGWVL